MIFCIMVVGAKNVKVKIQNSKLNAMRVYLKTNGMLSLFIRINQ